MPAPVASSALAPRPARTLRTIGAGLSTRLWAGLRAKPARVCYTDGGIGDELMLTAVAAAARRAGRPLDIVATYPKIWRGNPDPASLQSDVGRWHYARRRGWIDAEIVHLSYRHDTTRHIASQMADHLGLSLPDGWRPVLHGISPARREAGLVVVQNSCRGARYASSTKEWPQTRWRELAGRLSPRLRLVQVGTPADPAIPGAKDLRGRTSLREAATLLSQASLFLGLESGLMHLAAAVFTPSVIVFGGRTLTSQTGYAFNANLARTPPCAGCALNDGCPNGLVCLDIPVDEVEAAVHARLAAA